MRSEKWEVGSGEPFSCSVGWISGEGVLGGCFLPRKNAEKRGKTRECWRGEFLTTNDANEGEVVLGDLKFERRGQWSVVSGLGSVVQCARTGSDFLVAWGGGKVGVFGEFFLPLKNAEKRGSGGVGSFEPRMTRMRAKGFWGI